MVETLSLMLFAAALFGTVALTIQLLLVLRFRRKALKKPTRVTPISILKPLCGVDDDLLENLLSFAQLDHPDYEVVLGVKDASDPAWPIARELIREHPFRFRLVIQRGEPGLNPKVNQLCTLAAAAKHSILVVSDSNTRVSPDYLSELAAHFEDPEVACVTHPVVGIGEKKLGSLLDNLHLGSSIATGMIAAPAISGRYLVVGKSMALRRSALSAMGGFFEFRDHLAEDYVIGCRLMQSGQKIVVARSPVWNVSREKKVSDFFARYARWSVIHRTAIERSTYFAQALLNPSPLALLALLLAPSSSAAVLFFAILALKSVIDVSALRALRSEPIPNAASLSVPLKDALLFAAWIQGLFFRSVLWRGNRLRVTHGSRLISPASELSPETARP